MKKRKIVALVCAAAVLLLAVSAFGYIQSKLDKINKVPDTVDVIPPDQEDFETDTSNEPKDIIELKPEEVDWSEIEPFLDDDLLNILLVGRGAAALGLYDPVQYQSRYKADIDDLVFERSVCSDPRRLF